jgi:hypothetical protein
VGGNPDNIGAQAAVVGLRTWLKKQGVPEVWGVKSGESSFRNAKRMRASERMFAYHEARRAAREAKELGGE